MPLWLPGTHLLVDTSRAQRDLNFKSTPTTLALSDAADAFLSEGRDPNFGISTRVETEVLGRLSASCPEAANGVPEIGNVDKASTP